MADFYHTKEIKRKLAHELFLMRIEMNEAGEPEFDARPWKFSARKWEWILEKHWGLIVGITTFAWCKECAIFERSYIIKTKHNHHANKNQ